MSGRNTPDLRSPSAPLVHQWFFPFPFLCLLLLLLARSGILLSPSSPSQTPSRNTEHGACLNISSQLSSLAGSQAWRSLDFPAVQCCDFSHLSFRQQLISGLMWLRTGTPGDEQGDVTCERKSLRLCSPELCMLGRCSKKTNTNKSEGAALSLHPAP